MCVYRGLNVSPDEPFQCDCGHTVESGFVTTGTIKIMRKDELINVSFTFCDEEGCCGVAMEDALWRYTHKSHKQIMNSKDKRGYIDDLNRED